MKKIFILFCFVLSGCAGTYYVTDVDHRTHHPNCNICKYNKHYNHHWDWYNTHPTTNYIVVKPNNKPNKPNKPNNRPSFNNNNSNNNGSTRPNQTNTTRKPKR